MAWLPGLRRTGFRSFIPLLLVAFALLPGAATAHTEEQLHEHGPFGTDAGAVDTAKFGLTERLGEKIPLDLTFRDETGSPVRLADLVTVPTIILPVYYSCTNVCNFLQGGLASVLKDVRQKPGEEYRVISVSFDETETPELAAKYKRMYLASMNATFPENGWRFLTGDAKNIRRLTDGAGFRFARRGRDFIHPVASIIVARDGTIVRYLYGTTFLPKDLSLALLEARSGKVGATIRQVVGYCFTFDPTSKTYVFNLLRVSATIVIISTGAFLAFLFLTGKKRPVSLRGRHEAH
ncbi:SCO family protein [Geobacter hydrogenophilus]|uniref:Cytochrome-c oxidase n=1 Tax=Geobacter hydrogenophilus TaxID=40983 RepID=A0A9W6G0I1_9BACT|nr:SCO family protein [Geobacter hydrogenophilus]MBT0895490.1 SCO family protein [Geobacter hydrogenophilus]GLI38286.1 cytochrome-c oxidase [Geobacter hydrogenophilus]